MEKEPARRSGLDRRHDEHDVADDRRSDEERREVVAGQGRYIGFMKKIPLFRGLDDGEYRRLLNICYQKKLPAECYLFEAGDESGELYVLVRGKTRILLPSGLTMSEAQPVDVIGELGVFTGNTRTTSVITSEESVVLVIRKTELFRLMDNDHTMMYKVLVNVIRSLGGIIETLTGELDALQQKRRHSLV